MARSGDVLDVEDEGVDAFAPGEAFVPFGEFFAGDTFPSSGGFDMDCFRKASTCLKRFWRLLSLAICALASAVSLMLALPVALLSTK